MSSNSETEERIRLYVPPRPTSPAQLSFNHRKIEVYYRGLRVLFMFRDTLLFIPLHMDNGGVRQIKCMHDLLSPVHNCELSRTEPLAYCGRDFSVLAIGSRAGLPLRRVLKRTVHQSGH